MLELEIREEPWGEFEPEAKLLASLHWNEVDEGVEPRRRYAPNWGLMKKLVEAGCLKVYGARGAGRLVGYLLWQVAPDLESEGLAIAQMGPWFVLPGFPRAALQLWDYSIQALKGLGVRCLYPHHRTQGRGSALGKFFLRQGGKLTQQTYTLWIGADDAEY